MTQVLSVRKRKKRGIAAAKSARRERRESRARREAEWFYKVLGGRVPDEGTASAEVRSASAQVEAWLKAVPAFHRGALSLRYTPKEWPRAIVREFHELSSLVIRLECALHPATGKTNKELEQASIERIEKAIEARNAVLEEMKRAAETLKATGSKPMPVPPPRKDPWDPPTPAGVDIVGLDWRAERHVALAIRTLGKVRGDAPCVLPRAKPRKNATPVTALPPSSSVRLAEPAVDAPNSSVQWVAPVTEPSPTAGGETADEDVPSSQEVRTWH
jgi:hypothetical protein